MNTIFFWIAWGVISFWALKTYYFSYDKDKLRKLRLTVLGIDCSVLLLFFLPWPTERDNVFIALLFISIAASTLLFLTNNRMLLKVGSGLHMVTSVMFIITMMHLMPQTVTLSFQSIAPIIASLLLLVGNIVALLLWQQIQLKNSKKFR